MKKKQSPFLEQIRRSIRVRHYSIRTEQAYVDWTKRFILFHNKRHPRDMGESEVCAFLTHLAVDRKVAASTQNQALNALVFTYKEVLQRPLGDIVGAVRAKKPQKLPVVLTQVEVKHVLSALNGHHWLACCLLYGSGLRLMECIRLRVKDLDFDHRAVIVRDGKGRKDRVVTMPDALILPLQRHLGTVRNVHEKDLGDGFGKVYLPYALARKYPNAPKEWGWQYVFPSGNRSMDPRSDLVRRHHIDERSLQRAVRRAVREVDIHKPATCHTMRHYAASRIMPNGGFGLLCIVPHCQLQQQIRPFEHSA